MSDTLTREQVTTMPAGVVLTMLVAERFLGYRVRKHKFRALYDLVDAQGETVAATFGAVERAWAACPDLSTSDAAALAVLAKLRQRWWVRIEFPPRQSESVEVSLYADFWGQEDTPDHWVTGATLAEAVCRAALLTTLEG